MLQASRVFYYIDIHILQASRSCKEAALYVYRYIAGGLPRP